MRPGHLVLALMVVGQLGVEVVPGPAQVGRPGGVAVPEPVQRTGEAVEVTAEGRVDHLVHAHRRHRPSVGTTVRSRSRLRVRAARRVPWAGRPARRRRPVPPRPRTSPRPGTRTAPARMPCRGTGPLLRPAAPRPATGTSPWAP